MIRVTAFIIGVNVLLYLWQISTGVNSASPSFESAILWGADYVPLTFTEQPYRLFTSLFFHFGFVHLAMNMYVLYFFGRIAEEIYGHVYFLVLYICCGVFSSVFSDLFIQVNTISGGASGAIMGIGGALTATAFLKPELYLNKKVLVINMLINLGIGIVTPGVNNAAHIGGFLMGAGLSYIWVSYFKYKITISLIVSLTVILLLFFKIQKT